MGLKLRFGIAFSAEMVPKGVIDLSNPNGFGINGVKNIPS